MAGLPDTVQGVELVWTLLSLIALIFSTRVWLWAREDLRYVRSSERANLARSFVEDVRNSRWRIIISLALVLIGVISMTEPGRPGHRAVGGWLIIALLHLVPIQLVVRGISEATTRRTIISDVKRTQRKEIDE